MAGKSLAERQARQARRAEGVALARQYDAVLIQIMAAENEGLPIDDLVVEREALADKVAEAFGLVRG